MNMQQFCTFFVKGIFFGVNVRQVQEVIVNPEMTSVPLAPLDICGLINLRGQIVTVIDLQRRLEMGSAKLLPQLEDQLIFNVVVQTDDQVVSLLVDDIGDVLELSDDSFEPPPVTLKGKVLQVLQGAYKFEDGFLLILDPHKVLEIRE